MDIQLGTNTLRNTNGTFFIPGSLGAQEGGYTLLLMSFGYTEVTGITFALLRRFREIFWILIGLGCLMLFKDKDFPISTGPTPSN